MRKGESRCGRKWPGILVFRGRKMTIATREWVLVETHKRNIVSVPHAMAHPHSFFPSLERLPRNPW